MKLLKKQAEGKKKMRRIGNVDVPKDAFINVLKRKDKWMQPCQYITRKYYYCAKQVFVTERLNKEVRYADFNYMCPFAKEVV